MKNRVLKKLNNNNGASLMVALLFFVVCAVVGSIILTAAMTASGRMTGIKKNSEEYYALKSAVRVFKSDWSYGETTLYQDSDGNYKIRPAEIKLTKDYLYVSGIMESRNNMAVGLCQTGETQTATYTISATDLPTVKAVATMDENYDTEIVFNLAGSDEEVEGTGTITLVFNGAIQSFMTDNVNYLQVTWGNPQVYVGGTLR